mmetsp:Transcript_13562/g.46557  ORF Transcript_13562/g.46557 Transcript_13562/m.46557 type:complete len:438 (-) Transcript_13562:507-1820(-)
MARARRGSLLRRRAADDGQREAHLQGRARARGLGRDAAARGARRRVHGQGARDPGHVPAAVGVVALRTLLRRPRRRRAAGGYRRLPRAVVRRRESRGRGRQRRLLLARRLHRHSGGLQPARDRRRGRDNAQTVVERQGRAARVPVRPRDVLGRLGLRVRLLRVRLRHLVPHLPLRHRRGRHDVRALPHHDAARLQERPRQGRPGVGAGLRVRRAQRHAPAVPGHDRALARGPEVPADARGGGDAGRAEHLPGRGVPDARGGPAPPGAGLRDLRGPGDGLGGRGGRRRVDVARGVHRFRRHVGAHRRVRHVQFQGRRLRDGRDHLLPGRVHAARGHHGYGRRRRTDAQPHERRAGRRLLRAGQRYDNPRVRVRRGLRRRDGRGELPRLRLGLRAELLQHGGVHGPRRDRPREGELRVERPRVRVHGHVRPGERHAPGL